MKKTATNRNVTVLARYAIKRDGVYQGKHYKAGWVVLHVQNDQGKRYFVTLRPVGGHSCTCAHGSHKASSTTDVCYHVSRALEIEHAARPARIARHKARKDTAKLAQAINMAASTTAPDLSARGNLNGNRGFSLLRV